MDTVPGVRPNTVGLFLFGAGYNSWVIRPSACCEWWCTNSAKVLNRNSEDTYSCRGGEKSIFGLFSNTLVSYQFSML